MTLDKRIEQLKEYRDILKDVYELEELLGIVDGELPTSPHVGIPINQVKQEPKPKGGVRKKIDRGRVFALHRAGWSPNKIAEDVGCSANAIYHILGELKDMGGIEDGHSPE